MLSSIHPLGERAKDNSFPLTVSAFIAGSTLGGAATGAVVGLAALLVGPLFSETVSAWAFAGFALAAALAEWRGLRLPSWRRQVSEDWLTTYRGSVYGFGFGFQLGAGVLTIVTTAAVPLMLAAAVLSGSATTAVVVCATFGLVRGATILSVSRIDSSDQLVSFHRRLQASASGVRTLASSTMALTGVVAVTTMLS